MRKVKEKSMNQRTVKVSPIRTRTPGTAGDSTKEGVFAPKKCLPKEKKRDEKF